MNSDAPKSVAPSSGETPPAATTSDAKPKRRTGRLVLGALLTVVLTVGTLALLVNIFDRKQESRDTTLLCFVKQLWPCLEVGGRGRGRRSGQGSV